MATLSEVNLKYVLRRFSAQLAFGLLLSQLLVRTPAQTISIMDVSPNPVAPGQTMVAAFSSSSGSQGAPSGCVVTLIPYDQGNVASIINDAVPPYQARISIPDTMPLGNYALEVNCNSIPSGKYVGTSQVMKWVGAIKNVVVGGPPTINEYIGATPGKVATVNGTSFGLTQGQSFIHLVGAGVPDVYVTSANSWSNSQITFTVPEYTLPGNYTVEVQTAYGTSAGMATTIGANFYGWVDLHSHPMSYLGFGGKLIYGALDVGATLPPESPPPFGSCGSGPTAQTEQQALGQENMVHGGYGTDNACGDDIRYQVIQGLEAQLTPSAVYTDSTYKTSGYQGPNPSPPDFTTWPAWNDLVDQRMWINWIQRAYDGGQRVLVALAVNSRLLGDMTRGPGDLADDDKTTGDNQIAQIQAFVGRHSGLMQIAMSSSDVPSIIAQNKIAVVLGVELDNIGDLVGNQPDAAAVAEVDRLYAEGVRYIFPIHLVNNALGGSAVYVPLFDYANEYEEGSAYAMTCSQTSDDIGFILNPSIPTEVQIAEAAKLAQVLPTPAALSCPAGTGNVNSEGLTAAGTAAIQEMMNKHMLIDVDHMSQLSANATISLAQQHKPYPYPLFTGHNGVRSSGGSERALTAQQYQAIGALHGMAGVGSAQLTADKWLANYNQITGAMVKASGAGFGTDMDGMEFAMPPRPGSNVLYTTGTVPGCPSVSYLPISTEGNASWNYNAVGVAHYGMLSDFLEDVASLSGGCAAVASMSLGAQYFYETWRIAEGNASAIAPPKPAAPTPPAVPGECPGTQVLDTSALGNVYGLGPPCICSLGTGTMHGPGTCPTGPTSSTSTGIVVESGGSCSSDCKYGCNVKTGVCNPPPVQTHLPNK